MAVGFVPVCTCVCFYSIRTLKDYDPLIIHLSVRSIEYSSDAPSLLSVPEAVLYVRIRRRAVDTCCSPSTMSHVPAYQSSVLLK